MFIIVSFSACQNNKDTTNTAMGTSSETEETTTVPSSPKIKSLKEAAKSQQQMTAQKTKEAKGEEKKRLKAIENMPKAKKETLKLETKEKAMLSKENRIELGKGSTKDRILKNLRSRQKERNFNKLVPSEDFQQSMRGLSDMGLELVKQDGPPISGYDRDGEAEIINSYYLYVSHEKIWGGPFNFQNQPEMEESFLQDVHVFEAILKSKEVQNGTKPDLKITEIQFENEEAAREGLPKVKEISKAIFENPKHINEFWQAKERIYLIQTRAASFETVYERAKKVLYFTTTSSK